VYVYMYVYVYVRQKVFPPIHSITLHTYTIHTYRLSNRPSVAMIMISSCITGMEAVSASVGVCVYFYVCVCVCLGREGLMHICIYVYISIGSIGRSIEV
jgi:hypothetical protein